MSRPSPYLRARSPEQKEERRRHLLDTAKSLLLDMPEVHDLGIHELARRAQMTKSNVYRYFESSEAVLLDVLVEEFMLWLPERERHWVGTKLAEPSTASRAPFRRPWRHARCCAD